MKAVILCGGQGTRIRDVAGQIPKPMCYIGDRPLLWHIMRLYAHHGVTDFVLCLGYNSWKIKEYFLNFRSVTGDCTISPGTASVSFHDEVIEKDWTVTLAETGLETMTGARIMAVRRYVEGDEPFCVTYGDGLSNVAIDKLIAFHRAQGTTGTITAVHPVSRYGLVEIAGTLAMGFHEKAYDEARWINGGFMVFNGTTVWSYFSDDPGLILENGPLPAMVRDRQLSVFCHNGFWMGMDTAYEHGILNDLWSSGRAPWRVWE